MFVIGITGNIGCGKTTVAGMLRSRGVATIDADDVARRLREGDARVRDAILERFGTLDASELGRRVFADRDELAALETILHPPIRDRVNDELRRLETAGTTVAAVEAIKLLSSPIRERCDAIWVVTCDEADAARRISLGRGVTTSDVFARLQAQSPQAEKVLEADVVIDGSAPITETETQVVAALDAVRARVGAGTGTSPGGHPGLVG